ncbi:MAG TPA: sodium-dependent bicarbonate transport family permease [Longimicrobiales bacterium]|nr:sodium-dependent bicarbonate transport family permease [Longimicrobiales bacterium]
MDASLVLANILTPPILFFLLGMAATLLRSDLEIPQPITRALSLYLLFSIGMHGGVALARSGFHLATLLPLGVGVLGSALVPLVAFFVLRRRLSVEDAAAIAATYGSISAVTFITATSFLEDQGVAFGGHMVAAMALMESPAILVGVLLARRYQAVENGAAKGETALGPLLREALLNGPVFLLFGSLLVGLATGEKGWATVKPFADAPFRGVLSLFLLDMGIIAARRLDALRASGLFLTTFALAFPLLNASVAIAASALMDLPAGDALLLTVLFASASYIAVPAAVRVALPRANASLYLPMSLALTFPFNVALGIPLYYAVITALWS